MGDGTADISTRGRTNSERHNGRAVKQMGNNVINTERKPLFSLFNPNHIEHIVTGIWSHAVCKKRTPSLKFLLYPIGTISPVENFGLFIAKWTILLGGHVYI